MHPLSPSTRAMYDRILVRAYGKAIVGAAFAPGVAKWPESCRDLLRAAVRRKLTERQLAKEEIESMISTIPKDTTFRIKRAPKYPAEAEALAYEEAARKLLPPGKCAMALIPLALGLRAQEVIGLKRADVMRAVKTGADLLVLRKGGEEQELYVKHAIPLLEELLAAEPSTGVFRLAKPVGAGRPKTWTIAGEILSPGARSTAYQLLHRMIRSVGARAGIPGCRPHLMRHAFATRLMRSKAPLAVIQKFLNHKNITTTQRYLHADTSDAAEYLKKF